MTLINSCITLIILTCIFIVTSQAAQNTTSSDIYKGYTLCEDIRKVPQSYQCKFAITYCDDESRDATLSLDYLTLYYCNMQNKSLTLMVLFWCIVIFSCIFLFLMLGDTAEKYFGPALTQISQQVPKIRPRFAGVTLLAFANGAPDLSATVNAIQTCKFDMSLGALTGAGMFVNCFVAGWVIKLSDGAKCRGATIRDVSTYFITIFGVLISLFIGRFGVLFVVFAFLLYTTFILVVFGADEWHEKGRPDFWSMPFEKLSRFLRNITFKADHQGVEIHEGSIQAPVWATYTENTTQDRLDTHLLQNQNTNYMDHHQSNGVVVPKVWAHISPDRYRKQALAELAESDDDEFDYPLDDIVDDAQDLSDSQYYTFKNEIPNNNNGYATTDISSYIGGGGGASFVAFETERGSPADTENLVNINFLIKNKNGFLFQRSKKTICGGLVSAKSLNLMLMEEWHDLTLLSKILIIARIPGIVLQRATIPLTSREHYSKEWLVVSIGMSPILSLIYLDKLKLNDFGIAIVIGIISSIIMYYLTKNKKEAPKWSFGTSWPIGSSIIALYGLIIGVFWIDLLASELIDLLHFIGIVTGIPEAILGLTILAWGNSIGDFFTNQAIAKSGKGNMALTACYAGPVFNMLMGLGLGFIAFFISQGRKYASVNAQKQVILGCVFLLVHAALVILIGIKCGFKLPKNFGYFSMTLYILYLVIAVLLQVIGDASNGSSSDNGQC